MAPKRGKQAFCNCCENTFEPGELRIAADWMNKKAPYRHIACLDVLLPTPVKVAGLDTLPPEKRSEAIREIILSRKRRGIVEGHPEPVGRVTSVVLPIDQDGEFPAGCVFYLKY